jgi:6-phosphogluconate dehydrogenase
MDIEFGVIGLGRIGRGLARQAALCGARVVGFDVNVEPETESGDGLHIVGSARDLAAALKPPRKVLLYVPAGPTVDQAIDGLLPNLAAGDVVVDGGNSYWGDSMARQEILKQQSVGFIDLGTSGGVPGTREGACFMAGGEPEEFAKVEPILSMLAVEGGYVHAGGPGAGHYVKLVHNGIEFGMLQAIGEGVAMLEKVSDRVNVSEVLETYTRGSVIRGWLMELMAEAYREREGMSEVPGYIEDTGEVNWLVEDAMRMEVATPVITQSVLQLFQSRDGTRDWAKAVALMRRGFGEHPLGPDASVAGSRGRSRVGPTGQYPAPKKP